jgi:hypothetical protein
LFALASPTNELTFTVVPRGSGRRIGVDRDDDGYFDRTELEAGFDPADPASHGANTPPRLDQPEDMAVYNDQLLSMIAHAVDEESAAMTFRLGANTPAGAAINRTNGLFTWTPTLAQAGTTYRIGIQVTDDGTPPLSDEKEFVVVVDEVVPIPILRLEFSVGQPPTIFVRATPRKSYLLQFKNRLDADEWTDLETRVAESPELRFFDFTFNLTPQRFYRAVLLD